MDKNMDYITILIESLDKKIGALDEIIVLNIKQYESVTKDTIDDDAFNEAIQEKGECIKVIEEMDEGFDKIYNYVKDEIVANKEKYKKEIELLKEKIAEITEKSMEVQLGEKRNEQAVMKALADERKNIKQSKVSTKVASDYYKSMNKVNYVAPQFLDKKN